MHMCKGSLNVSNSKQHAGIVLPGMIDTTQEALHLHSYHPPLPLTAMVPLINLQDRRDTFGPLL